MAAKPFWRNIRLLHINIGLYLLILLVMLLFGQELRWAFNVLPEYLDGKIQSPMERQWYSDARKILRKKDDIREAQKLLEQSISIDSNTEAVYWLGEYFLKSQQDDQALEHFTKFLEIDPTAVEAYSKTAALLEKQHRHQEARQTLQKGVKYFEYQLTQYKPMNDADVDPQYNQKAFRLFSQYQEARQNLQTEIQRLTLRQNSSS